MIQWLRLCASTAGGAGFMVQDGARGKKKKKMPPSSNDVPRKDETSKSCSEHEHTAGEPKEGEAASPGGTALRCLLTPR